MSTLDHPAFEAAVATLPEPLQTYFKNSPDKELLPDASLVVDIYGAALAYRHLVGCSVFPTRTDDNKKKKKSPAIKTWRQYQTEMMSDRLIGIYFKPGYYGIAVVCGEVSGGLEVLDIESEETWQAFKAKVVSERGADYLARFYIVRTPKSGRHLYYRCPGHIEGAQRLAMRKVPGSDENYELAIETRGEGSYVLGVGSPAAAHPLGKRYEIEQLSPEEIPIITHDDRAYLLATARSLDERPAVVRERPVRAPGACEPTGDRPGDDFNERADWAAVLEPAGWQVCQVEGSVTYWTRPGKDPSEGHSATTGFCGDLLHVFSSAAYPFEPGGSYSKFAAYTLINHGGDYAAAAKQLASEGYGKQSKKITWDEIAGDEPAEPSAGCTVDPSKASSKTYQIAVLTRMAEELCDLFTDQYGNAMATVLDTWQTLPIESRSFQSWLHKVYRAEFGVNVKHEALTAVVQSLVLEALGRGTQTVYSRYATVEQGDQKTVYVNLHKGKFVEITPGGVRLVAKPSVKMMLGSTALPLPEPDTSAGKEMLTRLMAFVNYATDDDWILHVGFLAGCIDSQGDFPILDLNGPHGSAKTRAARVTRMILDPDSIPDRGMFKDEETLRASAKKNSVVVIDNVSHLSKNQSDLLCRLATGSGFESRMYYTNDEASCLYVCRPVVITRIGEVTRASDFQDRAVRVNLKKLNPNDYKDFDSDILPELTREMPKITGALYNAISIALRSTTEPAKKVRMLAYCKRVARAEPGLPWETGKHAELLQDDQEAAIRKNIVTHPVAIALIKLLIDKKTFSGIWLDLLRELQLHGLPLGGTARSLQITIDGIEPDLRRLGIAVEALKRKEQGRPVAISCEPDALENLKELVPAKASEGKKEPTAVSLNDLDAFENL